MQYFRLPKKIWLFGLNLFQLVVTCYLLAFESNCARFQSLINLIPSLYVCDPSIRKSKNWMFIWKKKNERFELLLFTLLMLHNNKKRSATSLIPLWRLTYYWRISFLSIFPKAHAKLKNLSLQWQLIALQMPSWRIFLQVKRPPNQRKYYDFHIKVAFFFFFASWLLLSPLLLMKNASVGARI